MDTSNYKKWRRKYGYEDDNDWSFTEYMQHKIREEIDFFDPKKKNDKKILLTSGCSFCANWPEILAKKLNRQLMNMGHGAAGNEIIHNHTIFATKKLLDSGINPKDILPIVSWGEVNRKDFVINKQDTVEYDFITTSGLPGINLSDCFVQGVSHGYLGDADSTWTKSGGLMGHSGYWKNYYKYYYTEEQHFLNTLHMIYYTQLFFEKHGIDYKMVVWQNIFNDRNKYFGNDTPEYFIGEGGSKGISFKSKGTQLLCDYYPTTKHIWEMIDFSKFIFYEDDDVSMGGIAEHNVQNGIILHGNHPIWEGCVKYVDEVLFPKVGDK
tara:strand:- start:5866 stop:6834 length:969 start_codon:yes stop_codon:yes gene_type:complete